MPDRVKKYVIAKAVIKAVDAEKFTVDAMISTPTIDRDREIIEINAIKRGMKEYKKHPVLLSSHMSYGNLLKQIGQANKFKFEDDKVTFRFEYYVGKGNKEADWGFFLATKGIAAFSIGFYPLEWEDGDFNKTGVWRKFTLIELLEVSQVLIPSNRGAYQTNSFDDISKELCVMAKKSLTDDDYINQDDYFEKTYHKEDKENGNANIEELPDANTEKFKKIDKAIKEISETLTGVNEFIKQNKKEDTQPSGKKHYSELILGGQDPDDETESKNVAPTTAQIVKNVFEENKKIVVITNAIKEACK